MVVINHCLMKLPLCLLVSSLALSAFSSAITVAHWQFNDLTDSSGNGHTLTNTSTATISGGIATFTGSGTGLLSTPNNAAWNDTSFTVETIFTFTQPSAAAISTLVSHLSDTTGRQWLLGTNNANVPIFLMREFGASSDTAFASSFGALANNNTYYLAAAIDLSASDPANRITFYLRNLTTDGPFQTNNVSTTFTALAGSTAPLAIGSTGHASSRLTGSIDEIRFSDTKLGPNDLLIAPIPEPSHLMLSGLGVVLLGIRRRRA